MELSRRRTYNLTIPLDFLYKNKIVKNIYNLTEDIQGYGDIEIGIFGLKDADISKKNNVHWVLKNLDKSSVLKSGIGDIKFNNISIGEYKLDVYIDDSLTANYKLDNIISNKYLNEYATLKFGINLDYITSIKPTNTDSDKGTLTVNFSDANSNFKFKYKKISDSTYSDWISGGSIQLLPAEYNIAFNSVDGYSTTVDTKVIIIANNTTIISASYTKKLTLSISREAISEFMSINSDFTYDVYINGKKTTYDKDAIIEINSGDKITISPILGLYHQDYWNQDYWNQDNSIHYTEYYNYYGISDKSTINTLDFTAINSNNIILLYFSETIEG